MWPLADRKGVSLSLSDTQFLIDLFCIQLYLISWYVIKRLKTRLIGQSYLRFHIDWGTFACFSSKQIACQFSLTHAWVLPNQQHFWRDFYICLCQDDAHFKHYSSINISVQNCLLYSYMSPWYAYFSLTVSHSAFRQIDMNDPVPPSRLSRHHRL